MHVEFEAKEGLHEEIGLVYGDLALVQSIYYGFFPFHYYRFCQVGHRQEHCPNSLRLHPPFKKNGKISVLNLNL